MPGTTSYGNGVSRGAGNAVAFSAQPLAKVRGARKPESCEGNRP